MAGKAEATIALEEYKGHTVGSSIDASVVLQYGLELGVIEEDDKSGVWIPGTHYKFPRKMDFKQTMATGKYGDEEWADDVIRFLVLREARRRGIETALGAGRNIVRLAAKEVVADA
jgi:hypothetical protein